MNTGLTQLASRDATDNIPAEEPSNLRRKMDSRDSRENYGDSGVASVASILLRIPLDSVLDIIRFLNCRDRTLLSLTCSYMRDAVKLLSHSNHVEDKNERTYINYLYCLARDMPYRWVCELCMGLHDISTRDTPRDMSDVHGSELTASFLYSHFVYRAKQFRLGHRHVQLAVKLSRLGNNLLKEHRLYLEAIMAPYAGVAVFREPPFRSGVYPAVHTVQCKIVDGRFLTLTTFAYNNNRRYGLSISTLGWLAVCKHHSLSALSRPYLVATSDPMTLSDALKTILRFPNLPVAGHCSQCPVDFEVSWMGDVLRVRAWADFGTDEGVEEGSWGAMVRCPRYGAGPSDGRAPPPKYPVGGLVRARYETAEALS